MSITTDLQRIQQAKEDLLDIAEARGTTIPSNPKIDDIPPLVAGLLQIETPYKTNLDLGWVNITGSDGAWTKATWTYQPENNNRVDMYRVKSGHRYRVFLGPITGSRFRVMFTTIDVSLVTENVVGTPIYALTNTKPFVTWSVTSCPNRYWEAPSDGYLVVHKENAGKNNIVTYCVDYTSWDNHGTPEWEE